MTPERALPPDVPVAPVGEDIARLVNQAVALHQAGKPDEAVPLYRRVLERVPEQTDALNFLGLAMGDQGNLDEASRLMEKSLRLAPLNAVYWANRATLFQKQGLDSAAEACIRRAATLEPTVPGNWLNLAHLLRGHARKAEAAEAYDQALALDPTLTEAWLLSGELHLEAGRPVEALAGLEKAAAVAPDDARVHLRLADALKRLGRDEEALASAERGRALSPETPEPHQTLASIHGHFWRHELAIEHYRKALALAPERGDLYQNLAVVLGDLHRLDETEEALLQAIARKPDDAGLRMQLGMTYLQHGLLEEGWSGLDFRKSAPPAFGFPVWRGEPLVGKRVLVVGEQGSGDHLQFVRFATTLAERGAHVDVLTSEPLVDLFRSLPGVGSVTHIITGETYDYWTQVMSVPLWLETRLADLPAHVPYLTPDPARVESWKARIDAVAGTRRRIGLVWAGNPEHARDAVRSMKLDDLAPLAAIPDVAWFSLQKGPSEAQLAHPPAGLNVEALGPELMDFHDTAAAMQALDLVIAVDTSAAHLAGALGRPVWVLLCAVPDWRWLLERSDSPWYPSARLFRQRVPMVWGDVVKDVAQALLADQPFASVDAG